MAATTVAPTTNELSLAGTPGTPALSFSQGNDSFIFMASLRAPRWSPDTRVPVDIVGVIDKSGSMNGEKIQLVKKTMQFVVEQLADST